jgi:hypothetical protein
MTTSCCGDVARTNIALRVRPYLKSTPVLACPNDPTSQYYSNAGKRFNPESARVSYEGHPGLSQGWSWPTFPTGKPTNTGQPLSLAAVREPALLQIAGDTNTATPHASIVPGTYRWNSVYADGHAKFSRFMDWWLPPQQQPWAWNLYNPTRPVDPETPCSPTCAEQAARY